MQRTLLASIIIMSLSACDGIALTEDPSKNNLQSPVNNSTVNTVTAVDTTSVDQSVVDTTVIDTTVIDTTVIETPVIIAIPDESVTTTVVATDTGTANQTTTIPNWIIGDDAASSTSDGGQNSGHIDDHIDSDAGDGKYEDDDSGDYYIDYFGDDKDDRDTSDTNQSMLDQQISDDAASSTSDGGQVSNNADNNTFDGGQISDDAGSSTSDGGQISNNTDTNTSDNGQIIDDTDTNASDDGQISDDSGSSTSDGGQTSDDAASSTSDGGTVTDDSASSSSDGAQTNDNSSAQNTNGGNFESDNIGGSIIRQSSLTTTATQNICTTASAQSNFSDTRVGDFILHNNAWRPFRAFPGYEWEQCIYTNTNGAVVGWNYDWGPGQSGVNGATSPSGDFYVRSYPELIYGVKDEFRTSAPKSVTGMPVELGQLPNISIDYSYNGPQFGGSRTVDASNNPRFPNGTTISGERNVAIESFFYNKDAAGQCSEGIVTRNGGSNHVYEVMVWLDAGAERLPAGPSDFVTDLTIRGDQYKVYTKASDPRYIAFVAQNPQNTGTIFWNDYIDWAKDNAHRVQQLFGARSNSVQIQNDWCVANIIVGTEIFWGAGNLDIFDWTITQSQ